MMEKKNENGTDTGVSYADELNGRLKVLDELAKPTEKKRKLSSGQRRTILIQIAVWILALVALFFVARDVMRYVTVSGRVDELIERGDLERALSIIDAQDGRMYARLEKQRYDIAVVYYGKGEYERALELFETVTAYGDLSRYIASCKEKLGL